MSNESDQVPAGWYATPNGGRRYWDGQRWLALPDPDQHVETTASTTAGGVPHRRKGVLIATVAAAVGIAVAGIGLIVGKSNHDTEMRNAASEASSSKAAADEVADRVRRDEEDKREKRVATVKEVEAAVKAMAQKQSDGGLFDGPVLSVECSPVGGGSTDDLTAKTTVFACFVATKDNGDGTMSGEKYHATVNWDAHDYTYGYGAPR